MSYYISDKDYIGLTVAQRQVLDCFRYANVPLTVANIYIKLKKLKKKISAKTIQRAVAKLCKRGVIECLAPGKKGRGYSNMYIVAEERDAEEPDEKAVREEVKEIAEEEFRKDEKTLAEINALITKHRIGLKDCG